MKKIESEDPYTVAAFRESGWPLRIDQAIEVLEFYNKPGNLRLLGSHGAEFTEAFGEPSGRYNNRPYWHLEYKSCRYFIFSSPNNGGTSIETITEEGTLLNGDVALAFVKALIKKIPALLKESKASKKK